MKIAEAVKAHLVSLALNDNLPMDMNDISEFSLETIISRALKLPSKREQTIAKAGEYLTFDEDVDIIKAIKSIAKHKDQTKIIDYLKDVSVWQKVEMEFTCEQFLEQIGYRSEERRVEKECRSRWSPYH